MWSKNGPVDGCSPNSYTARVSPIGAWYDRGMERDTEAQRHGEYKTPGGKLVVVDCVVRGGRIAGAEVTGDFFLYPDDALDAITAALNGLRATATEPEIAAAIRAALPPDVTFLGFSPEAVATATARAVSNEQ